MSGTGLSIRGPTLTLLYSAIFLLESCLADLEVDKPVKAESKPVNSHFEHNSCDEKGNFSLQSAIAMNSLSGACAFTNSLPIHFLG